MNRKKIVYIVQIMIFSILMVFIISSLGWAATYYVDATNGHDDNDGLSPSTAWKTISKVNSSKFGPGDKILFKRDEIWREMLNISNSGNIKTPIYYGTYGAGTKPIISAMDVITGWIPYGNDIYYVHLPLETNVVIIDDFALTIGDGKDSLNDKEFYYDEISQRLYIKDVDGNPNVTGKIIEASQREYCIYSLKQNHVVLDGLYLKGSIIYAIFLKFSSDWLVTDCTIKYSYNDAIRTWEVDNFTIEDSEIYACYGPSGDNLHLAFSDNFTIKNNYLSMVYAPPENTKGNIHASGVDGEGMSGGYIAYNKCIGGAFGIDVTASDVLIEYNWLENHNKETWSSGILISVNHDLENFLCHHNIILNPTIGICVYEHHKREGLKFYNNTIYNALRWGALFEQSTMSGEFKNNILWCPNFSDNIYYFEANLLQGQSWDSDHNLIGPEGSNFIYWNGDIYHTLFEFQKVESLDKHSVSSNPKFVDLFKNNFKLQSTSCCIDAGEDVGLSIDFAGYPIYQGNGVDIGAFEYERISAPQNVRIIYQP